MRRTAIAALMALVAAPSTASVETRLSSREADSPVEWLYPEIPVDDDSWRGLLPVILLDTEALANQPGLNDERSERR